MDARFADLCKMTDEELCARVSLGSREAEDQLAERYTKLVRVCSRPFFIAGGDVEDLIQEGMLGLLKAIREYRPERGTLFRTYAELCIKTKLYSAIKSAARDKHTPLNNSLSINALSFGSESNTVAAELSADPEEILIGQEQAEELTSALKGQLSGFEAKVLGSYLEGLSTSEIAEKLNRSPKSVDNAVQRVRQKAARHLKLGVSR